MPVTEPTMDSNDTPIGTLGLGEKNFRGPKHYDCTINFFQDQKKFFSKYAISALSSPTNVYQFPIPG